ncbi:MAG: sugar transferase [Microbacteriaceae bacterium]|nr:sugar transferase [Microbacteriaceae bacterium]
MTEAQVARQTVSAAHVDRGWARRYARAVAFTDLLVVIWAVVGAQLLRFGVSATEERAVQLSSRMNVQVSYTIITVGLILAWMAMLAVFKTRDARIVGVGATEYRLVVQATMWLFGLGAIVLFLTKTDIARAYILIALPLGLLFLLVSRWLWRHWLSARRRRGEASYRVVLVGSRVSIAAIARDLARVPVAGYHVVAAVVPGVVSGTTTLADRPIPLSGDIEAIQDVMRAHEADTLVIASSDELSPERIRRMSWDLEPGRQHLVMAPSLTDIGGPRIHTRPVAGLPLMHVETPAFEGAQLFLKRIFDLLGSGALIALLSPLLLVIALIVGLSSPGPVLFRQERVGRQGRPFHMLKFRSMVVDAEQQLEGLLDRQRDAGNAVLFKMQHDPRVTPIGRFIRRYSIDELPQLFNVFGGQMSLVGPRPPLPREVAAYDDHVHRKFLVKPGITGLWQVGGRSQLSWEESVRLDLYYVENWSITGDIVILWRTLKAVVGRDGAY